MSKTKILTRGVSKYSFQSSSSIFLKCLFVSCERQILLGSYISICYCGASNQQHWNKMVLSPNGKFIEFHYPGERKMSLADETESNFTFVNEKAN